MRLYLLRHAKSSWDEGVEDFDRPLAPRGRETIAAMAAFIADQGYVPTVIGCSTALRTRETLAALLPHLSDELDIRLTRRIYEAEPESLLEDIRAGGTGNALMVIGHNPGFEDLAALLAVDGDADALQRMHEKFPTAALAVIEFDAASWADIGPGTGRLVAFHTPKSISAEG